MDTTEKIARYRARRSKLVRLAVIFLFSLGALIVGIMFLENSLIFFPRRYPVGDWQPADLRFEDAWFEAADGTRLHGWYLPAAAPRAVVLFAHGNAGHVADRADWLDHLQSEMQASVLAFDYRGYGRSEGRPNERGVLADARAARAWLAKRAGVDEREIVLAGESIGGAVVIDLAARDGARGLVIENSFTSIPDVAAFHYPGLPVRWVLRTRLDSLSKIADYQGPLLLVHGDADSIVPFEMGQRLFEAAAGPKRMVVVPGGDHNDPRAEEYLTALDEFFDTLPSVDGRAIEPSPMP